MFVSTTTINLIIVLLIILLGVIVVLLVQLRRLRDDKLSKNTQKLMQEVVDTRARMDMLQSQINPHFLYNTLESIRSKALIEGIDDVAEMTETLARLFRYNIGVGKQMASISQEIENVKNYVKIQNYRFRDKFNLLVETEEIKDLIEEFQIPVLTLQPLVENAIHHGLEHKVGKGTVYIRGELLENAFLLRIEDDGVGVPIDRLREIHEKINSSEPVPEAASGKKGSGIAIANIDKRIKMTYGEQYGLDIRSAENVGTQVVIKFPKVFESEQTKHEE